MKQTGMCETGVQGASVDDPSGDLTIPQGESARASKQRRPTVTKHPAIVGVF